MALVVWSLSAEAAALPPLAGLALLVAAGMGAYAAIAVALDIAELRALARGSLLRMRGRAAKGRDVAPIPFERKPL
jgi:hypothetical protein